VSETWVGSLVEERSRGRVVGLYATVWGGGLALGPAILSFVGTEGPRPFMVAACTLLAAGVPVVLARRIAPRVNGGQAGGMLLESLRVAPVVMGAAFVCGLAETAFVSLYPVYGLEHGFTEPVVVLQISIGAAGSLALQQPFGWLADKLDRRWLLVAVSAIASACTLAIPLVLETWAIWPVVFLLGGAIAGFYTLGLVLLGQRFAEGDLAGANTAFIMSYTLGMVVGPVVAGSSMRLVPDHGLVLTLAGFFVAFFAWTLADRLARHD
jgi:MFS family permease